MIGVIPNPKKTFQVERPVAEVKEAIEYIPFISDKYKLDKSDLVINQFTFDATEFLSVGVWIDINCFSINDARTEVIIEVRRKIGTFDKSFEVNNAHTHLSNLTDLISKAISTDPAVRASQILALKTEKKNREEAEKLQAEEQRRILEEMKQNNPVQYYAREALIYLISIAMIGGSAWLIYKMFSS